ncbi:flagellin [Paenibacillus elgii]
MIIAHNLSAINAKNVLKKNDIKSSKTSEKLSSGLRINRAADDAAGLSISEKMRAQIRGLNQAQRNVQDGISLIQTAEGGLNEVHEMLQRINELAVQAANGTYSDNDRKAIQKEVVGLIEAIDNIANHTEFNGIKLLNGTSSDGMIFTANYIATWTFNNLPNDGDQIDIVDLASRFHATFEFESPTNSDEFWINTPIKTDLSLTLSALKSTFDAVKSRAIRFPTEQDAVTEMHICGNTVIITTDKPISIGSSNGISANLISGNPATTTISGFGGITIQSGTNVEDKINIDCPDVSTFAIGINSIDLSTSAGASNSIKLIKNAIDSVSASRSKLGAYQNQLQHTMSNVNNYTENLAAAESRIRDTDIAKEMIVYTKNNILTQTAQAMLAQANQQPQSLLLLLK